MWRCMYYANQFCTYVTYVYCFTCICKCTHSCEYIPTHNESYCVLKHSQLAMGCFFWMMRRLTWTRFFVLGVASCHLWRMMKLAVAGPRCSTMEQAAKPPSPTPVSSMINGCSHGPIPTPVSQQSNYLSHYEPPSSPIISQLLTSLISYIVSYELTINNC